MVSKASFGSRHARGLAAAMMAALLPGAVAAAGVDGAPSPECAKRDLAVVTEIEQLGNAGLVAGEKLAAALFLVLDARNACRAGDAEAALKIYDGITFE